MFTPRARPTGRRVARLPPILATTLVTTVASCGAPEGEPGPSDQSGGAETGLRGRVLVSAAASLTDAFGEMEAAFEGRHAGVDVALNLGGSSSLRTQILEGAPVDVFASANRENMDRVVSEGQVAGAPRFFATNLLQIAVPAGNPAAIEGLEDFGLEALRLGLCAEAVPCGAFARQVFERAGIIPAPDTDEPDARALLTKIELGELDAGITYVTDVAAAGGAVEGIDIPADVNVVAEYPIARLSAAPNPDAAAAFVRFVLSDEGRAVLTRHGFRPP